MLGREQECQLINRLLLDARRGRGGSLVLHGEPGVGKSRLLDYAAGAAPDMRVVRCVAVESEVDIPFHGLSDLLGSMVQLLDRLPVPQRQALERALHRSAEAGGDRLLVAVGVLTLLSEAAGEKPLLGIVDDAQWLDDESAGALAFAARRFDADNVVLLVASRAEPWPGLPHRQVDGLNKDDAVALLRRRRLALSDDVCDYLAEQTGGNPLALTELAGRVEAEHIATHSPLPVTERLQQAFAAEAALLPEETQRLLLIAAADDTGDPVVVFGAARELGIGTQALDAAERARLLCLDGAGALAFRHPLVRAAVYRGAPPAERRVVHRALADSVDGQVDRRAWHLAASAPGPDDGTATELERAADAARTCGGHAAAATALERAAELSTAPTDRLRRLTGAADAAYQAGQLHRAAALTAKVDPPADQPLVRADNDALRGVIECLRGRPGSSYSMFMSAAGLRAREDPAAAVTLLVPAWRGAAIAGDIDGVLRASKELSTVDVSSRRLLAAVQSAYVGVGRLFADDLAGGIRLLKDGIEALMSGRTDGEGFDRLTAWQAAGELTIAIGDDEAGIELANEDVTRCRIAGMVGRLPLALANLAIVELNAGSHTCAQAHVSEAVQFARDSGYERMATGIERIYLPWFAALAGDEETCRSAVARMEPSTTKSLLFGHLPGWGLGLLELALGHADQAVRTLNGTLRQHASGPFAKINIIPDLVDACVRAGRRQSAAEEHIWFDEWAMGSGQAWARAVRHRCRAWLAPDARATDEEFTTALAWHDRGGTRDRPVERARTQLAYGEWLRRVRRKEEARVHLNGAYETFTRIAATAWAVRAAGELRAAGQPVRAGGVPRAKLTPQEFTVVRLAARGGSNKEIAAELFLSPRTVGYHLGNAFPKLGIASRRELAHIDLGQLAGLASVDLRGP